MCFQYSINEIVKTTTLSSLWIPRRPCSLETTELVGQLLYMYVWGMYVYVCMNLVCMGCIICILWVPTLSYLLFLCMYICIYVYVCMYVCMYVYFNKWRSDRVLVRLGLNTLIGWLHAVRCMYIWSG